MAPRHECNYIGHYVSCRSVCRSLCASSPSHIFLHDCDLCSLRKIRRLITIFKISCSVFHYGWISARSKKRRLFALPLSFLLFPWAFCSFPEILPLLSPWSSSSSLVPFSACVSLSLSFFVHWWCKEHAWQKLEKPNSQKNHNPNPNPQLSLRPGVSQESWQANKKK